MIRAEAALHGPLFAWSEGAALRDLGMTIAEAAQERDAPGWSDRACAAIVRVALITPFVHVDDVLAVFTEQPAHPNAWGAVWRRAIRNGVICHSGHFSASRDRKKHKHQYPVYQSLVYAAPAREVATTMR